MRRKLNYYLLIPIAIGLVARLLLWTTEGADITLNSDDIGYIGSAKHLLAEGEFTYFNIEEPTVHLMPGIVFLIAGIFLVFGSGTIGILATKLVMIGLGILTIYGTYKIGAYLHSQLAGGIAAFLVATFVPMILSDNLILTESPFSSAFIWFVYYSIKLADSHKMSDFYWVIGLYLTMLMFRPTIALLPFVLLIYFVIKKYPLRLALKQVGIAAILLVAVLSPWWIRNYMAFEEFIPLSGGAGNPMLLGTYQGHGYRYGDPIQVEIDRIIEENPGITRYEQNQKQEEIAHERMAIMWEHNKIRFIETYTWRKFEAQWKTPFYWIEIFGIKTEAVVKQHQILAYAGIFSLFSIYFILKRRWKEWTFILLILAYFTALNNVFFAFNRYNQPLMPLLFIALSCLLTFSFQKLRHR